jgi:hypothetical protein
MATVEDFPMNPLAKNRTNYVDALENEHPYAVLTKRGRIQILVQPTRERLRKRGKRGWRLFSTVDNGYSDAGPILTATIQEAIQELERTGLGVENNGKKSEVGEG